MSQHWATIGEAGALTGLRIMVWIHSHLGRMSFNIALVPVMLYFFIRRPIARKASRDFLRKVSNKYPDSLGGQPNLWMSYRHFFAFGQSLIDKYIAWMTAPPGIAMDPDDEKLMYSVVDSGVGVLLIGSHFGNLEYARGISHRHPDSVINILIYDQHAANFATLVGDLAPDSRMNLIQVTDLDLDLALRLKERVDSGEWLLIAGDRVPVGTSDNVGAATFFDEQANFPIGPYVLATLLRCPVYLLHCFREKKQYQLSIELFADEILPSRQNKRRNYDREVQKFATALERRVLHDPLQWFNFYDFWGEQDTSQMQTGSLRDHDQD